MIRHFVFQSTPACSPLPFTRVSLPPLPLPRPPPLAPRPPLIPPIPSGFGVAFLTSTWLWEKVIQDQRSRLNTRKKYRDNIPINMSHVQIHVFSGKLCFRSAALIILKRKVPCGRKEKSIWENLQPLHFLHYTTVSWMERYTPLLSTRVLICMRY